MKRIIILTFLSLTLSFSAAHAVEPLCNSTAGKLLSWELTSDVGLIFQVSDEKRALYIQTSNKLKENFKKYCDSDKSAKEIIDLISKDCTAAALPISKDETRFAYLSVCDKVKLSAQSFVEGYESVVKCDDKDKISNLSRAIKKISTFEAEKAPLAPGNISK